MASASTHRVILAVFLIGLLGSCSYVADRAVDFIDPYRVAAGVGTTVGARGRALGLVDSGLMFGVKPRDTAIGWRYGLPAWPGLGGGEVDADQAELILAHSLVGLDYADGSYRSARRSIAILPAVFSWVDATPSDVAWQVPDEGGDYRDELWLWSGDAFERVRYQQVHAFDVEFEVGLLGYLDLGYSPGELLDFFLGLVGIDLARDDGRIF